jgi:hypothetical protein
MKLLAGSIHHKLDNNEYSFFILDHDTNKIIKAIPHTPDLDPIIYDTVDIKLILRPFGIAQGMGKIFIASNQRIVSFDAKTFDQIEVVSSSGVPNTHQIAYYDECLYRTNTSNDSITKIDLNSLEETHYCFKTMGQVDSLTMPVTDAEDTMHFNSITIYDELVYTLAHNRNSTSKIYVMDLGLTTVIDTIDLPGKQFHEIVFHDGYIYTLGSPDGTLVKISLHTKIADTRRIMDPSKYFLRGAFIKDNSLIAFGNKNLKEAGDRSKRSALRLSINLDTNKIEKSIVPELDAITSIQIYQDTLL